MTSPRRRCHGAVVPHPLTRRHAGVATTLIDERIEPFRMVPTDLVAMTVETFTARRAYEIAAKASAAPGPGGIPIQQPIEVRQVMGAPSSDL